MKEHNWSRERHVRAIKDLTDASCPHSFGKAIYCARCVGFQIDRYAFEESVEDINRQMKQMTAQVSELRESQEENRDRVARIERFLNEAVGGKA